MARTIVSAMRRYDGYPHAVVQRHVRLERNHVDQVRLGRVLDRLVGRHEEGAIVGIRANVTGVGHARCHCVCRTGLGEGERYLLRVFVRAGPSENETGDGRCDERQEHLHSAYETAVSSPEAPGSRDGGCKRLGRPGTAF